MSTKVINCKKCGKRLFSNHSREFSICTACERDKGD